MRQVATKGLLTVVATGGVIAATGGLAYADAGAFGGAADSPGVLAGNAVQVPVHVPVNLCGNTVNVVGLLNPVFGNHCANVSTHPGGGGSVAHGGAHGSPGVGSGNAVQAPVDVPLNVCGNGVSVVGLLNPVFGNDCANVSTPPDTPVTPGNPSNPGHPGHPGHPGTPRTPGTPGNPGTPSTPGNPGTPNTPGNPGTPDTPVSHRAPAAPGAGSGTLAHTGSDGMAGSAFAAGALLLGGALLYRRGRGARH
jgi:LPXTG-motif cell wall-anchored protein